MEPRFSPDHYLIPRRLGGKQYDPTAEPLGVEDCVAEANRKRGTKRTPTTRPAAPRDNEAGGVQASEQTIMSIAGHVSREMLEHYSHIRMEAKRRAVESLANVTNYVTIARMAAPGGTAEEAASRSEEKQKVRRGGQI